MNKELPCNNLTIDFNLFCGGTLSQLEVLVKAFVYNPNLLEKVNAASSIYLRLGEQFKQYWVNRGITVNIPNWFDSVFNQFLDENTEVLDLNPDILCNGNNTLPSTNLVTNKMDRDLLPLMRSVVNILCKWKPSLIDDVNHYYDKWELDFNTLGIHLRTTDMNSVHSVWGTADLNDYVNLIRKVVSENPNINKIFIASDAVKSLNYIKSIDGLPPIYHFDIERIDPDLNNTSYFAKQCYNWQNEHNSYELFRDIHMLSKFPVFIGRISSVTNFSLILNENIKKYYCINEFANDHMVLEEARRNFIKALVNYGEKIELSEEDLEKFVKINGIGT